MKIKLTSPDGATLILLASNKIEFAFDLAQQTANSHLLMDLHEEFDKGWDSVLAYGTYTYTNPMNPDENFTLLELI
jgi:hypothetical protein